MFRAQSCESAELCEAREGGEPPDLRAREGRRVLALVPLRHRTQGVQSTRVRDVPPSESWRIREVRDAGRRDSTRLPSHAGHTVATILSCPSLLFVRPGGRSTLPRWLVAAALALATAAIACDSKHNNNPALARFVRRAEQLQNAPAGEFSVSLLAAARLARAMRGPQENGLLVDKCESSADASVVSRLRMLTLGDSRGFEGLSLEQQTEAFEDAWWGGGMEPEYKELYRLVKDNTGDSHVRLRTIQLLGRADICCCCFGCTPIASALTATLRDPSAEVVVNGCNSLARYITRHRVLDVIHGFAVLESVAEIAKLSRHRDPSVRIAALAAIRLTEATHGAYMWHHHPVFTPTGRGPDLLATCYRFREELKGDPDPEIRALATLPVAKRKATWGMW